MYKRFGNSSSVNTKAYEQGMNPENCGYAQRIFKISPNEEVIEIRNPKNRHLEQKLHINQLKGILLSTASKQVIKSKKNLSSKPNGEISKLINTDYIQFTILITEGNLDVITPSYQAFRTVEGAVNELITNRRNLYTILKLLENNN